MDSDVVFNKIIIILIIMIVFCSFGISLVPDEKKYKKIKLVIEFTLVMLFFALLGVVLPGLCFLAMFENIASILWIFCVVVIVWSAVSLFIEMKNKFIILYNHDKEIYIRDVNVKYSPAVLSYLMNNKIEVTKDLPATLLHLCLKECLRINTDTDGNIKIEDLKNIKEVGKLNNDEKYAYEMLVSGVNNTKINNWKNIVKKEYSKYGFSKEHKTDMLSYLIGIYAVMFLIMFIWFLFGINTINPAEIMLEAVFVAFFTIWEYTLFVEGRNGLFALIMPREDVYQKEEFMGTYTDKGAIEYNKWKKFEKYIKDYTLIKDRDHKSIVVLGEYLSYSIALGINKNCDNEIYNQIKSKYLFDLSKITSLYEDIQDYMSNPNN